MDINIKVFRIFRQVMRDGNFSKAARYLKIAQPTVSQQIAKLEADLETTLFERVGHEIIATESAKELLEFVESLLDQVDEFDENFKTKRSQPKGKVRYAMPESCQWTPHFKKIMSQTSELPEVQFEIQILPNELIIKGILEGSLDFGFVTGEKLAPELRFEKFSDERYSAISSEKNHFEGLKPHSKKPLRLISYPGYELFFMTWAKTNGVWNHFKSQIQAPSVYVGTLAGAIHAVKEGAGVAIIPTHCISDEINGFFF
jgi:DNA-binding transcriptional LysR family regulator